MTNPRRTATEIDQSVRIIELERQIKELTAKDFHNNKFSHRHFHEKYKEALEKIGNNSIKSPMECKTDNCPTSWGACYDCKLKQSVNIAQNALKGEENEQSR